MTQAWPPFGNTKRERLIESHLPLVRTVARRYLGRGEELDDLVQVGTVGLIKAADRFDPSRGVSFRAFAAPAIEGEVRRHLRDRTGSLRIPRALQRMTGELQHCREKLTASLGRSPTVHELATELGVEDDDVERALLAAQARSSLEISVGDQPVGAETTAEAELRTDDRLLVTRSMRLLSERERRIVFLRFHADKTERQIAEIVGISQAQVSRVLTSALSKLRQHLARGADGSGSGDITSAGAVSDASAPGETMQGKAETGSRIAAVGGAPENPNGDTTREKVSRGHSGRFLVRMPSELHEQLAQAAGRDHVSLNRFVTDALAASVAATEPASVVPTEPASVAPTEPASVAPTEPSPRVPEPAATEAAEPARPSRQEHQPRGRALRVALAMNVVLVAVAGVGALVLLVLALEHGV